jgi:acyl carrier protein
MSVSENDIKQKIKAYIAQEQRVSEKELDEEQSLFEAGIIDSMGAFDLTAFLEATFNIKFEEEHFFDRRFRSIQGIASLIMEIKASQ